MPAKLFNFSGQAMVDTFAIDLDSLLVMQRRYEEMMVNKYCLSLEAIRKHLDEFAYWQRQRSTGRPPVQKRDLMIAFLVRQLFNSTFRQLQALLKLLREYFSLERVPHHTVLSRKNRTARWAHLWQRFHDFVLESLPRRSVVVATDATGFSGRKRPWREVDHGLKATQD